MNYIRKIQELIRESNPDLISLSTDLYNRLKNEVIKYNGPPKDNKNTLHINGVLIYENKELNKDYQLHHRTLP